MFDSGIFLLEIFSMMVSGKAFVIKNGKRKGQIPNFFWVPSPLPPPHPAPRWCARMLGPPHTRRRQNE